MNTQDRIALVLGRLVIEQEVKAEQLEMAAKRIAELEEKNEQS
jgi:hypothetical protein